MSERTDFVTGPSAKKKEKSLKTDFLYCLSLN